MSESNKIDLAKKNEETEGKIQVRRRNRRVIVERLLGIL